MSESKHDEGAEHPGAWMETPEFLELKRRARLERERRESGQSPPRIVRKPGSMKGKIWVPPDFDDTDEDIIRSFEGDD